MKENILTMQTQTEALIISDLFNEVASCGCKVPSDLTHFQPQLNQNKPTSTESISWFTPVNFNHIKYLSRNKI